jgi:hypothetical protein
MKGFKRALVAIASAVLVSCGGGGGGGDGDGGAVNVGGVVVGPVGGTSTLSVEISYSSEPLSLFTETTVVPFQSGFDGHTPSCALRSGALPVGLTLRSDCTIVGRPTQPGGSTFEVEVGASGVSNSIRIFPSLTVVGPSIGYLQHDTVGRLRVGDAVNDVVLVGNWKAPTDVAVSWSYSVASGELPPGIVLDPSSGGVTGQAQVAGAYTATIGSVLTTPFGTFRVQPTPYTANVNVESFAFQNTGGTGDTQTTDSVPILYVSQPAQLTPVVTGSLLKLDLNGATLPPGLSIDAAGVVSGTPLPPEGGYSISGLIATASNGNVQYTTTGTLRFVLRYPTRVEYEFTLPGTVGKPFSVAPLVRVASPLPLVAPSYTYRTRPGECTLPSGMSLDPVTGVASGTPTETGLFSCNVDVQVQNNGMSWTQLAVFGFSVF